MNSICKTRLFNVFNILFVLITTIITVHETPAQDILTGIFPAPEAFELYPGPFIKEGHQDLLVLHGSGHIRIQGASHETRRLALYSFDGGSFREVWLSRFNMFRHSSPRRGIYTTAWCCGDFDGDGVYEILTFPNEQIRYFVDKYSFDEDGRNRTIIRKVPKVWIDQAIGCDINGDGVDEIVTLEFSIEDSIKYAYHAGVYELRGDSLVHLWTGLEDIGENPSWMPPTKFVTKCRLPDYTGEVPVLMGPQSDVRPSRFSIIFRNEHGEYESAKPFSSNEPSPCGEISLFRDDNRVIGYGTFLDYSQKEFYNRFTFGLYNGRNWEVLGKTENNAEGAMCRFTIDGEQGWLFIYDGIYTFYKKRPYKINK